MTNFIENNLTEIIRLFSNMNLDNIPLIDINNLIDIINNSLKIDNNIEFRIVDVRLI